ncbi:DNA polymerase nu isoform X2 [Arapaima gigas]
MRLKAKDPCSLDARLLSEPAKRILAALRAQYSEQILARQLLTRTGCVVRRMAQQGERCPPAQEHPFDKELCRTERDSDSDNIMEQAEMFSLPLQTNLLDYNRTKYGTEEAMFSINFSLKRPPGEQVVPRGSVCKAVRDHQGNHGRNREEGHITIRGQICDEAESHGEGFMAVKKTWCPQVGVGPVGGPEAQLWVSKDQQGSVICCPDWVHCSTVAKDRQGGSQSGMGTVSRMHMSLMIEGERGSSSEHHSRQEEAMLLKELTEVRTPAEATKQERDQTGCSRERDSSWWSWKSDKGQHLRSVQTWEAQRKGGNPGRTESPAVCNPNPDLPHLGQLHPLMLPCSSDFSAEAIDVSSRGQDSTAVVTPEHTLTLCENGTIPLNPKLTFMHPGKGWRSSFIKTMTPFQCGNSQNPGSQEVSLKRKYCPPSQKTSEVENVEKCVSLSLQGFQRPVQEQGENINAPQVPKLPERLSEEVRMVQAVLGADGEQEGRSTAPLCSDSARQDKPRRVSHCDGIQDPETFATSSPMEHLLLGQNNRGGMAGQKKLPKSSVFLTSDPQVQDVGRLSEEEQTQVLLEVTKMPVLILTIVYQDGTTQLDPDQKSCRPVSGILVLMKREQCVVAADEGLSPGDSLIYLRLDNRPMWAKQDQDNNLDLFIRSMLLSIVGGCQKVVCYKAKDLLRTALQHFEGQFMAHCQLLDPQIAAWLLDPADSASSFQHLVAKYSKRLSRDPAPQVSPRKVNLQSVLASDSLCHVSNVCLQCTHLSILPLSCLVSGLDVLVFCAAMESHKIHVDKDALKKTSELLGIRLRQLEQEAHQAAGQQFLVASSVQLRLILFEKLRLQERCESQRLPRTLLTQQQSTSEAALFQLRDLHPLPGIILEYRQVHKLKSTYVDRVLSCANQAFVSPTWNQTSTVTGRLSAKHPNFQAVPRQPVHIPTIRKLPGAALETTVHPRSMFVPQDGWKFLAADFCQVELRLLAHLSSDPKLLHVFHEPAADVFTMLASKWKRVPEAQLNAEDRECAKRVVYSVVYGAGKELLSRILGVSSEQASSFVDSFLQTYKEVQGFIHRTVQQCHIQGYVSSIMGRQRFLPKIHSLDRGLRNQAERQAVNFVVQASAADLCKMAMIRIFCQVSCSPSLTARLIAQIHDELLFEVEDAQLVEFAGLVKTTMESLQDINSLGIHLKVPLKVALSSGSSWGSMSELHLPTAPSSPAL